MCRCLIAVMVVFGATVARGGTFYDNLGAEDSFSSTPWTIREASNPTPIRIAVGFSPAGSTTLSSLDLLLSVRGGSSDTLLVKLLEDASGLPDETGELETWTLSGLPNSAAIQTLHSASNPTVLAGNQYWVAVFAGNATTTGDWYQNNQGLTGIAADTGSGWYTAAAPTAALRVSGTVVPLPPAAPVGLGLLATLGAAKRLRRRRGST